MTYERIFDVGCQVCDQFSPLIHAEAGTDPDMLQLAQIIEESQQQGANRRTLALLMPAKAGNYAIAIPLVFYL